MRKYQLEQWCKRAVSGIRYVPDQMPVYRALYQEGEAIYDRHIAAGLSHKEAEALALQELGSAEDRIAPLAKAHPPLPGRLLQFTKGALLAVSLVALLCFGFFILENIYLVPAFRSFDGRMHFPFGGEPRLLQSYDSHPSASSDGYSLRVDRTALWQRTLAGSTDEYMNIQLKSFNPIPWAEAAGFSPWIWAEDSLGNYYYADHTDSIATSPAIRAEDYRTGLFTHVHDLWLIPCISQEAQWLELHYDRDGRDLCWRIDLTGGAQ